MIPDGVYRNTGASGNLPPEPLYSLWTFEGTSVVKETKYCRDPYTTETGTIEEDTVSFGTGDYDTVWDVTLNADRSVSYRSPGGEGILLPEGSPEAEELLARFAAEFPDCFD